MADTGRLLASSALAALLAAQTAQAQEGAPPAVTKTDQHAMAASDIAAMDAIIIRKQKVERALQDTAANVADYDAKRFRAELFATNVRDKEHFTFNPGDPNRGAVAVFGDPRVIGDRILVNF